MASVRDRHLFEIIQIGEIGWEDRFTIWDVLDKHRKFWGMPYRAIVTEDFKLYAHKAQAQVNNDFPSVRFIGILDSYCHTRNVPLVFQMASVRKSVKVLDEHKDLIKSSPHSRDAYQHLRYYIVVQGNRNS